MTFKDPFQPKLSYGFVKNVKNQTEMFHLKVIFKVEVNGSLSLCFHVSHPTLSLMRPLWVLCCGANGSSGSLGALIWNGSSCLTVTVGGYAFSGADMPSLLVFLYFYRTDLWFSVVLFGWFQQVEFIQVRVEGAETGEEWKQHSPVLCREFRKHYRCSFHVLPF